MCDMTDEEIFRKVNEIENKLSALYQDPDADEGEIFKLQDEMNFLLRSTEERRNAVNGQEDYWKYHDTQEYFQWVDEEQERLGQDEKGQDEKGQ